MLRTAALVAFLFGCGGSSKPVAEPQHAELSNQEPTPVQADAPKPQSEVEMVMAKMVTFKDAMCACKDSDCAKRVSDDMTAWSQDYAKREQEPVRLTEADQKRAVEIGTKMGECMQTAMGMGSGGAATP